MLVCFLLTIVCPRVKTLASNIWQTSGPRCLKNLKEQVLSLDQEYDSCQLVWGEGEINDFKEELLGNKILTLPIFGTACLRWFYPILSHDVPRYLLSYTSVFSILHLMAGWKQSQVLQQGGVSHQSIDPCVHASIGFQLTCF